MGRGVGDGKIGQNRKPDAFLKSQRKKKSNYFSIFWVPIFSDPKFGRVVGGGPPRGSPSQGGSARRTVKFHFSVDFESYGAVHTTFTTKTMVEMGVEHVILARGGLVSEIRPGRKVAFWATRGPGGLRVTGGPKSPFSGRKVGVEAAGGRTVGRCE